jgi:hypothetical protein
MSCMDGTNPKNKMLRTTKKSYWNGKEMVMYKLRKLKDIRNSLNLITNTSSGVLVIIHGKKRKSVLSVQW